MSSRNPLHTRTHKLAAEQQTMELDTISPRYKNPLSILDTTRVIPPEADTKLLEQQFPLMKLLPELRIRIYECVFADLANSLTPRSLSTLQNLDDHLRPRLRGFLALLHASRALRFEVIEVYCLSAKARLVTLNKTIQDMYAAIEVSGKVPSWAILMEAHARELAIGKLEILLRVISCVMNEGEEKRGWGFSALKTALMVDDAGRMGCD